MMRWIDEIIVHVLGGYVASQCKINEMYAHTTSFMLEHLNFCSKWSLEVRQIWWVWVNDNKLFISFNLVISIFWIVKYFIQAVEL